MNENTKEIVTLRERPMKNGGKSLLLDYVVDGIRRREFLKMYLIPERTAVDRIQNKETIKQAMAVKAKRTLELQASPYNLSVRPKRSGILLSDYVGKLEEDYTGRGKAEYAHTLGKIRNWLGKYGRPVPVALVDPDYVLGFLHYMQKHLAESTVHTLYSNLNTVLNKAVRADLIPANPMMKIDPAQRPPKPESTREYLTLDEVRALAATPCGNDAVKRAFLFACFTGLRLGDLEKLDWSMIIPTGKGGWQVRERQTKTGGMVYAPLSDNALLWLPNGPREGMVFPLPSRAGTGIYMKKWTKDAGITKAVTFHSSRHTYATLLLSYGADIYTVSSLLGHRDVATTQIYAKIVDEKKRKAVDSIPDLRKKPAKKRKK